jgi:hypothetical protein
MSVARELREELAGIIDAVAIFSASSFTFAGAPSTGLATPMMGLQLAPDAPPLMNELVSRLYQHCFCKRFTGQVETNETPSAGSDAAWMENLSRANQSRERWEDGWQTLASMPGGQVIARRGSLTRVLAPGEFVNLSGSGVFLAPGATVRVYVPRESVAVQPAYYFAFGETFPDSSDELSTVRFYWNVSAEGAAELLRILSAELNRWQVPFRFKTGVHPAMLSRRDSAVLYVPRRCAPFTHELLAGPLERIGPSLRADVPVFTLRLARGLAFAEDPGTQESFGMSRCRMLAQGLWGAYLEGVRNLEERFAAVERHFRSEGIALERPWLNPGSTDDLAFAAAEGQAA